MFTRSVWHHSEAILVAVVAAALVESVQPYGVTYEMIVVTGLAVLVGVMAIKMMAGYRHGRDDSDATEA